MRRAAVLAAAGFLLFAAGAAPENGISGVAYFREHTVTATHNGTYPGAVQAWRTRVLLLHAPKTVGSGGIACIYVDNTRRECFGTYSLPQGRLKMIGEITNRSTFTLEIVGGTGVYQGATGTAEFTPGLVTFFLL